jgi:DNA ligase D-like protein (predicted 3'-phosphoesterase)
MKIQKGERMAKKLARYRKKRDFKKTIEPAGKKIAQKEGKKPIFVIQQHDARAMHYDVRLEIGGVLVSWAVPKGPSLNPAVKRLAVMTENHPMAYAKFEGIIPEGQYGAGPVILWDRGTYTQLRDESIKTSLRNGQIAVMLRGKKLRGGFAFIRTSPVTEEKSQWLMIKMRDEHAHGRRNPVSSAPESIKSKKTIKQMKKRKKKS